MAWSWKAAVVPPLVALAIYFGAIYFLLPLYRRRQTYSQYLPVALAPSDEPGFVSRTRGRIQERVRSFVEERIWHRRSSSGGAEFNFGDEELEEDLHTGHLNGLSEDAETGGRRLSRDLEAGFRDDSDDDNNTPRRS
ncbi:MAG: hypothetical protein MMC23_006623 [Stictis urceolatum]|nr:hypothetical protein [Stictis urceolata]